MSWRNAPAARRSALLLERRAVELQRRVDMHADHEQFPPVQFFEGHDEQDINCVPHAISAVYDASDCFNHEITNGPLFCAP